MKNFFILAAFAIILFACKKDRTCSCTVTKSGTSTTTGKAEIILFPGFPTPLADTSFVTDINDVQSYDKKIEKVTKRVGQSNCVSYTEPYNETTLTTVPASSFNLSVVVNDKGERRYSCKLK